MRKLECGEITQSWDLRPILAPKYTSPRAPYCFSWPLHSAHAQWCPQGTAGHLRWTANLKLMTSRKDRWAGVNSGIATHLLPCCSKHSSGTRRSTWPQLHNGRPPGMSLNVYEILPTERQKPISHIWVHTHPTVINNSRNSITYKSVIPQIICRILN